MRRLLSAAVALPIVAVVALSSSACVVHRREPPREVRVDEHREERHDDHKEEHHDEHRDNHR